MITWSDPREQKSSCAPRGIPLTIPAQAQFTHEQPNPGGIVGYLPCTRSKSPSEWAVSNVQDSLGTCMTGSSSGTGVEEVGADTGVMGSFLATSSISKFKRPSFSMRGTRHWWSSGTAPQKHSWGHSGLQSTALKSHGQGDCFFPPHFLVVAAPLEIFWGKIFPPPVHFQIGWGGPPSILLQLCSGCPEDHSLLVDQFLDGRITGTLE